MNLLLAFLGFFLADMNAPATVVADYTGEWEYSVVSPDYTYKGVMEISKEGDALTGIITAEDTETELSDVMIDGNTLTFNMNVQGFRCDVKGTFDGDEFEGEVSVEGMALPMKASRL